jgi:hypothetical protein
MSLNQWRSPEAYVINSYGDYARLSGSK